MLARLAFLPALLIITILSSVAPPISRGQTGAGEFNCHNGGFVIDIRSRSQDPGRLIASLQHRGIELIGVTIDNGGATPCTHILVGRFGSADAAARYGASLVARGIIETFLVTAMPGCSEVTRPRRASDTRRSPAREISGMDLLAKPVSNRGDNHVTVPWDLTLKQTEP